MPVNSVDAMMEGILDGVMDFDWEKYGLLNVKLRLTNDDDSVAEWVIDLITDIAYNLMADTVPDLEDEFAKGAAEGS